MRLNRCRSLYIDLFFDNYAALLCIGRASQSDTWDVSLLSQVLQALETVRRDLGDLVSVQVKLGERAGQPWRDHHSRVTSLQWCKKYSHSLLE